MARQEAGAPLWWLRKAEKVFPPGPPAGLGRAAASTDPAGAPPSAAAAPSCFSTAVRMRLMWPTFAPYWRSCDWSSSSTCWEEVCVCGVCACVRPCVRAYVTSAGSTTQTKPHRVTEKLGDVGDIVDPAVLKGRRELQADT